MVERMVPMLVPSAYRPGRSRSRTSVLEQNRAPNGDYFIWLDPRYIERLRRWAARAT